MIVIELHIKLDGRQDMDTYSSPYSIKLRQITDEDFEAVLKWSKDTSFCLANGWELNRSPKELYSWWLRCVNNATDEFIRLGIEVNGDLVGYADLACIKGKSAELGLAIGESRLWGKGISFAAAKLLMDYATTNMRISTFSAETHEANIRSRKMLEKLGFQEISRNGGEEYCGKNSQLIQYRLH